MLRTDQWMCQVCCFVLAHMVFFRLRLAQTELLSFELARSAAACVSLLFAGGFSLVAATRLATIAVIWESFVSSDSVGSRNRPSVKRSVSRSAARKRKTSN